MLTLYIPPIYPRGVVRVYCTDLMLLTLIFGCISEAHTSSQKRDAFKGSRVFGIVFICKTLLAKFSCQHRSEQI